MPLLTGRFLRSLDAKHRLALPKPHRESLGCQPDSKVFVTLGLDACLAVYTEEAFHGFAARVRHASPTQTEVRAFTRLFFSLSEECEIDRQGRIRLPSSLLDEVGMESEVVVIGAMDHLEIWGKQRWQQYWERNRAEYERVAEAALRPNESA
ncbi:MAG: division/cell wall cluster transcriptional repressor MraZ [Thermogutta sp.]|nr:division/cell wall cluster transcriptional repressor MraZ [Thermogutta sp.]